MIEFVQWLTGTHLCGCGAKYTVAVTKVPTGNVICEKCGTLMDRASNRSFFTYERTWGMNDADKCRRARVILRGFSLQLYSAVSVGIIAA
jgi:hypothetical protein